MSGPPCYRFPQSTGPHPEPDGTQTGIRFGKRVYRNLFQITLMGFPAYGTSEMRRSDTFRREAPTAQDPDRLLLSSLVAVLAMPALILAVAHPTPTVAFVAGLVAANALTDSAAVRRRVQGLPARLRTRTAPAN